MQASSRHSEEPPELGALRALAQLLRAASDRSDKAHCPSRDRGEMILVRHLRGVQQPEEIAPVLLVFLELGRAS